MWHPAQLLTCEPIESDVQLSLQMDLGPRQHCIVVESPGPLQDKPVQLHELRTKRKPQLLFQVLNTVVSPAASLR